MIQLMVMGDFYIRQSISSALENMWHKSLVFPSMNKRKKNQGKKKGCRLNVTMPSRYFYFLALVL